MKPVIKLDDPLVARVWANCVRAHAAVEEWPAWKRSEDVLGGQRAPLPATQPPGSKPRT